MPDILKEMTEAVTERIGRSIARDARQRGINGGAAGRLFGSDQPYGGGNGQTTQNFFTTGYDSGTGKTTVALLPDFSIVDSTDILTS